ncbi:DJ-1/PfpI family protein [Runella slithyformis]|uniref:ThiJ/PfpI domain-containing protein n=1 Tax=Runella slithyformis (strain ATCC 29530 / DSM 19594 / LMG 11500 / NCIMB 11436 / LSU 4) TaxID=761193 RepID=A0A7U3ZQ79_RUNSL|nr:DJ-1/PfpI family protein [Runella slithyformis]AEI51316.1 ThiJ/PfpI domain-containing protein [Runella slithyformis DSM 19594]
MNAHFIKKYLLSALLVISSFTAFSHSGADADSSKATPKKIGILLFNQFETLDVFGPVEVFGRLKDLYIIQFYSLEGGIISSTQNVKIVTEKLPENEKLDIFLIPGGQGTRKEVNHTTLIEKIQMLSASSVYTLTVCTGSALLAKSGQLDGITATSNKRAYDWATSQGPKVKWIKKARWTVDGKFYTSAGISAGMDMALGFISDRHGIDLARKTAYEIEYTWQENREVDEFYLQDLKSK